MESGTIIKVKCRSSRALLRAKSMIQILEVNHGDDPEEMILNFLGDAAIVKNKLHPH
jgi:hypothetical protein